jgi:hypothetical protein
MTLPTVGEKYVWFIQRHRPDFALGPFLAVVDLETSKQTSLSWQIFD